jgi:hypothetical protein
MTQGLSDTLTLQGIAKYNVKIRYKLERQKMTDKERASIKTPGYLEKVPPFSNHHHLDYLNKWVEAKGIVPFFDNVKPLCDDDPREVFLSDYFNQQQERNAQGFLNSVSKECTCKLCEGLTATSIEPGGIIDMVPVEDVAMPVVIAANCLNPLPPPLPPLPLLLPFCLSPPQPYLLSFYPPQAPPFNGFLQTH